MEALPANELSIPLGQVISYLLISTLCFFFRKHKLGLIISFIYVFNWGFLFSSSNFVDAVGRPTMGLFTYLASGFAVAVLIAVAFFREE